MTNITLCKVTMSKYDATITVTHREASALLLAGYASSVVVVDESQTELAPMMYTTTLDDGEHGEVIVDISGLELRQLLNTYIISKMVKKGVRTYA